ncbi:hypothetical protein ACF0H5_021641 [Mactra antiquata]
MCGRTACTLAPDDLCKACKFTDKNGKTQKPAWRDATNGKSYFPSYNIAPGAHTPVLMSSKHVSDLGTDIVSSTRVIQPMLWGLIPSWHKGTVGSKAYETNNCRAESMLEKMTYKVPLQKGRRCVILAEGFYEWKRDKNTKQPYYIYFPENKSLFTDTRNNDDIKADQSCVKKEDTNDNNKNKIDEVKSEIKHDRKDEKSYPRLLTMAGVFDVWKPSQDSEPVYSYSVITVESSPVMSTIHHRMPALLTTDEAIDNWLNFGDVPLNKASKLIHAVTCIESHQVSNVVNNSRNNQPECIKKIDPSKPKKSAGSLFMSAWLSSSQKVKVESSTKIKAEGESSTKVKVEGEPLTKDKVEGEPPTKKFKNS